MTDVISIEFNEKRRLELIERGRQSTYFFAQGLLGMPDLDPRPHLSLCENLDGRGEWGPWKRAMICATRGFLKSSIATIAWPLHEAIYQPNWACRILGSSHDNVKNNFFSVMRRTFQSGPQRNFLLWLYSPWIQGEFDLWNDSQIVFHDPILGRDPLAQPSITYRGIGSDQEGWHGEAVIVDDPEGSDAEKSRSVNIDAERAVDAAIPLLKRPADDKILVVLTPWGANPLAYKLKERAGWKVWWMPIVDSEGNSNWPARYSKGQIDYLRKTTPSETWESQFMLRKPSEGKTLLNYESVKAGFARWKVPGQIIEYPHVEFDQEKLKKGEHSLRVVRKTVDVMNLRYYQHIDPVHKEDPRSKKFTGTARPSKGAIVIVGVAPDFHAFVMGTWAERVDLDKQVHATYRFYRLFAPYEVTFDPTGAQVWFKDYAASKERSDPAFRQIVSVQSSYSTSRLLPNLTSRLIEDRRPARASKETVISERLDPWIQGCMLHFFDDQEEILHQVKNFPDETDYVDLVDALAQGPPVWKPPLGNDLQKRKIAAGKRSQMDRHPVTGYFNPHAQPLLPKETGDKKPW